MPRLDFENKFAGQLKDRELQPSKESWDKLQERLEKEEKRSFSRFWWMGVAASIVAAVFIFSSTYQDEVLQRDPEIVNTPVEESMEDIKQQEKQAIQVAVEELDNTVEQLQPQGSMKIDPGTVKNFAASKEETIAENVSPVSGEALKAEEMGEPAFAVQDLKQDPGESIGDKNAIAAVTDAEIEALLAKVSKMEEENGTVTDTEIDALLAEATAEIINEKEYMRTASYNAESLLQEVETELEHSFKEQVFEALKAGFQKTRTAVANRIN